ncbi:hypothetical protein D5086_027779 [Populus alba]|uniref:Uncharacterized protein n=1 Tax=Populus alba TaxID=43335 RepID=A0ACC4AWI7_POPAL
MSISIGGKNFRNAIINGQDTDIGCAPPMSNTRMFLSPPFLSKPQAMAAALGSLIIFLTTFKPAILT